MTVIDAQDKIEVHDIVVTSSIMIIRQAYVMLLIKNIKA